MATLIMHGVRLSSGRAAARAKLGHMVIAEGVAPPTFISALDWTAWLPESRRLKQASPANWATPWVMYVRRAANF